LLRKEKVTSRGREGRLLPLIFSYPKGGKDELKAGEKKTMKPSNVLAKKVNRVTRSFGRKRQGPQQ